MSNETTPSPVEETADLRFFIASLLKGALYQDKDPSGFAQLITLKPKIDDYVRVLGLMLIIDPNEGYAYLKSRPEAEDETAGERRPPRLIARRSLSFQVSLLLALLRRRLSEFDSQGSETRLVLSRTDIVEMVRVFMPATHNEVKLASNVEMSINKVVELGFLRPLSAAGDARTEATYEVDRILKAFVDAQWLTSLNDRLAAYRTHLESTATAEIDDE